MMDLASSLDKRFLQWSDFLYKEMNLLKNLYR